MNTKLKALAAAVGSIGAAGTAQAQINIIQVTGSSAFHSEAESLFVSYCTQGTIDKYVSGLSSASSHSNDIIRMICLSTSAAMGLSATLDFTYDSLGGSWRGFTACGSIGIPVVSSLDQQPVTTVTTGTCTASTTVTINGKAVTQHTGCGEVPAGVATNLGFTDVESSLFFASNENQPGMLAGSGVVFPSTLGACTEEPVLGVVWAIAVSKPLWLAMEQDQAAAGILPASCSSNIDESNQICGPFISKSQYRSLVQGNGHGDIHYDFASLFTANAAPNVAGAQWAPTLERRDPGSGAQAAANAYFLNIGCTPVGKALISQTVAIGNGDTDGTGMSLHINPSTILVQVGLRRDVYGIGHLSADKCPTLGTPYSGTQTGSYGCLKLAGSAVNAKLVPPFSPNKGAFNYPISDNVVTGYYDYTSEEQMYVPINLPGYVSVFLNDFLQQTASSINNSTFYSLTGITPIPNPMTVPTIGTYYRVGPSPAGSPHTGGSNMCAGLVDTF